MLATAQHNFGGYYPDCWRLGIECADGISATRELYETVIRHKVAGRNPNNLTMLLGHAVDDFIWDDAGTTITGQLVELRLLCARLVALN